MAPTAFVWPTPTPMQHPLPASHSLTYIENGIRDPKTLHITYKSLWGKGVCLVSLCAFVYEREIERESKRVS